MFGREKVAAIVAEFLGTFTLVMAVLSMVRLVSFAFFGATVAGAVLALMVLVIGKTSGSHINPAVTIGLWTLRKIDTLTGAVYIGAQMLGGFVAWTLSEYLLDTTLKNVANATFDWRVLIAEAVGALIFTFAIAAAVYQNYQGLRQAVTIGGGLTIGIIVAAVGANGVLNPAVALGIQSWSFAYVTGPILGSIVGMNLYALLFAGQSLKPVAVKAKATTRKKK